jgi:hypothetical protein
MNRPQTAQDRAIGAVPAPIARYFDEHSTAGMPEMARLLEMDVKTLRKHVVAQELVGRFKGVGRIYRRRVFTLEDTLRFLNRPSAQEPECRSIAPKQAGSGTTISRSAVLAFPARPGVTMNVTRPKSKPSKKSKPAP